MSIIRSGRFAAMEGRVDLRDPSRDSVVWGFAIVEGDADTGDGAEALELAAAIALECGWGGLVLDEAEARELVDGADPADSDELVYVDCSGYGHGVGYLDAWRTTVEPLGEVDGALEALARMEAAYGDPVGHAMAVTFGGDPGARDAAVGEATARVLAMRDPSSPDPDAGADGTLRVSFESTDGTAREVAGSIARAISDEGTDAEVLGVPFEWELDDR